MDISPDNAEGVLDTSLMWQQRKLSVQNVLPKNKFNDFLFTEYAWTNSVNFFPGKQAKWLQIG